MALLKIQPDFMKFQSAETDFTYVKAYDRYSHSALSFRDNLSLVNFK